MNRLAAVSHLLKISSTAVKTITPRAQKIVCIFSVGNCQFVSMSRAAAPFEKGCFTRLFIWGPRVE